MWSTQPSSTCRSTTSAAWSTSRALWCAVRRPGLCTRVPRFFAMLLAHGRARSCAVQRGHRAPAAAAAVLDVAAAAGQGCDDTTKMVVKACHAPRAPECDCDSVVCGVPQECFCTGHQAQARLCSPRWGGELRLATLQRPAFSSNLLLPCSWLCLQHAAENVAGTQALARQSGACFINVRASTLQSKWFGDTQKLVQATFTLAYKIQPCIIFIGKQSLTALRIAVCPLQQNACLDRCLHVTKLAIALVKC